MFQPSTNYQSTINQPSTNYQPTINQLTREGGVGFGEADRPLPTDRGQTKGRCNLPLIRVVLIH